MAIVDTGTVVVRVNQTKLRKNFDKMADVPVILKDEHADEQADELAPPENPDAVAYLDRLWLPITQSKTDFSAIVLLFLLAQFSVCGRGSSDRPSNRHARPDKRQDDFCLVPFCMYTANCGIHGHSASRGQTRHRPVL